MSGGENMGLEEGQRVTSTATSYFNNFDDMGLADSLLRGIYSYGFERPSAIQARAVGPMIEGRDLIAQAQSGTGKTAAFTIGVLGRVDPAVNAVQALILSPTRELSIQTEKVIVSISQYMHIRVVQCVGGCPAAVTAQNIRDGAHIVVGCPGRVLDMLEKKVLDPSRIRVLVLDEADEMLGMGFKDQIYDIFQFMPKEMQVGLFSATMPNEAIAMSKKIMRSPVEILVKREELTLEGIKQFYIAVGDEKWKLDTLCDLYKTLSIAQCVIFCNTRRKVEFVSKAMSDKGFTIGHTHGDLDPETRRRIIQEFKTGSTRMLVTTDLLARGIDVQQVSLVINYDLPTNMENYLHRIGRSARFGRKGVAINFVTQRDIDLMRDLEKHYDTQISEMPASIADLL